MARGAGISRFCLRYYFLVLFLAFSSYGCPLDAARRSSCAIFLSGIEARVAELVGLQSLVRKSSEALSRAAEPWEISALQPEEIDSLFRNSSSLTTALVELTKALIEERLAQLPPELALRIREKMKTIREAASSDFTSAFDEMDNRLLVSWRYPIVAIHEIDHAIFLNANRSTLNWFRFTGISRQIFPIGISWYILTLLEIETWAIGAQWELATRIPRRVREKMIEELETNMLGRKPKPWLAQALTFKPHEGDLERLTYLSLKMAHLDKRDFIKQIAPHHGYTLGRFLRIYVPVTAAQIATWTWVAYEYVTTMNL